MFPVGLQTMVQNRIPALLDRHPEIRAQRRATELFTKMGIAWPKKLHAYAGGK